jgi:hypothetical protein
MGDSFVLPGLKRKRAEIAGIVADLKKQIRRHQATLAHLDASIKLWAPDTRPDRIPNKRLYVRNRVFKPGEMPRLALDILRTATESMTTAEIGAAMIARKGASVADEPNLLRFTSDRASMVLAKLEKRKLVERVDGGPVLRWQLVNNP